MNFPIKVNYKYTSNSYLANKWLHELPDMFAADFEVASRYTNKEKELAACRLNMTKDREVKRELRQIVESDGLSYPSYTCITHLSIAISDRDSFIIICDNDGIRKLVTNFLVTTNKLQLWHNCSYDFKHIYYLQHRIPKNFIDTQLLAKSLINNADNLSGDTKLKSLMGYAYGAWAVARESNFILEDMYNEDMLKYTAIDSAATYKLYCDILEDIHASY